jgi:hypothetical protein
LSRGIYFAGSISGGRGDAQLYQQIIHLLQGYGRVLTEHVGDLSLDAGGEPSPTSEEIYERDIALLAQADKVVAEVTIPSHGVGYEIARAESLGKAVLCLHRPGTGRRLSAMLAGNPNVRCADYCTLEDVTGILDRFFGKQAADERS